MGGERETKDSRRKKKQQKEQKGYYPISGKEPIEESTLIPEVKIEEDSKSTSKKKYRKDILDRISGRDEYLKYLEDNQDAFKELNSIEKNLNSFSKGTKEYNSLIKKRSELIKSLSKKENALKEDLYKKELNNYVYADKGSKLYVDAYNQAIDGIRYNVIYHLDNPNYGRYVIQ